MRENYTFLNAELIQPIQRKKVDDFIGKHSSNENINRIIVFGSSVTNLCHIDSDVDVYLELVENKPIKRYVYNYLLDIWNNYSVDAKMLNEINEKGVVVYERRNLS